MSTRTWNYSIVFFVFLFFRINACADTSFEFKGGGVVKNWFMLGPIEKEDVSIDYLKDLTGGRLKKIDAKTSVKVVTDTSFKAYLSKFVQSDSDGYLNITDTLFDSISSVLYFGTLIKTFTSETVRFFFSCNARVKLIVDGIEITSGRKRYNYLFPGKSFDLKLRQGTIPVIAKVINPRKGDNISLRLYPVADSLKVFEEHIKSISVNTLYSKDKSTLSFDYSFNISTDSNMFGASAILTDISDDTILRVMSDTVKPGKRYDIVIPSSIQNKNFLALKISSVIGGKEITGESYFALCESDYIKEKLAKQIASLDYGVDKSFVKFVLDGFKLWSSASIVSTDLLSNSDKNRVLATIEKSFANVNLLINESTVAKNGFIIPVSIENSLLDTALTPSDTLYDNCRWLNYKYPGRYSIIPAKKYGALIFIPYRAKKKKKIPITLLLHSSVENSTSLLDLSNYPYLEFAHAKRKFPSAVVMLHADSTAIWDHVFTGKIINTFSNFSDIDIRRLNIAGEEMGGFEALHLAQCFPELVSNVAVLNAFGNSDQLDLLKDVPVMFIYGVDNSIIPVKNVKSSVLQLRNVGNYKAKLEVLSEGGDLISRMVFTVPEFYKKFYRYKK